MKSHIALLKQLLNDISNWCCTSTTRDFETVTRRLEHEGNSFLTITLPAFCQDFERGLELGRVSSSSFCGFHKRRALPQFLGGLLRMVFDSESGVLLKETNIHAIFAIRQFCLFSKKVSDTCSDARSRKAFMSFLQSNRDVSDWEKSFDHLFSFEIDGQPKSPDVRANRILPAEMVDFRKVSSILWKDSLRDEKFLPENLVPKHGPGATSERISGNRKYEIRSWHQRLQPYFPADLFAIPSWNFIDMLDHMDFPSPESELPCRVVQVPKTMKTPRIIAIEPVCMQYTQQSLMEVLVGILDSKSFFNNAIGFSDQTENQEWALRSSESGSYATIDLKDASDRVSNRLVIEMLADTPLFRGAVQACRSIRVDIPGYGIHTVSRFASMGSALCFPIEAMVFFTICLSAIARYRGLQLSREVLLEISRDVRIYGDDIIIPVNYVQAVMNELEYFNLRVNSNKSFAIGKFRESCGMDAYDGIQVTPVYLRSWLPTSRHQTSAMLSTISLRNQLYRAGYWETCKFLDNFLKRLIPLPVVLETSPIAGRVSFLGFQEGTRWDSKLHNYLVKGIIVRTQPRSSFLDGPGALLKFFVKRGLEPSFDPKHLKFGGRPVAVFTQQQWALPY